MESFHHRSPRLGYLSAAPRVSTRPDAGASGPRSHVLGVMQAFEALGWQVRPFIVGDRTTRKWNAQGSELKLSKWILPRVTADLIRVGLGWLNARRAWQELGRQVDWVYERFAVLQALGWTFQRSGIPWILETSGPFFHEAKVDRKAIVLDKLARSMEKWAYQQCDVLICVSEALREFLVEQLDISARKILVVPNGVDLAFFDPERHPPKRLFQGCTIGYVGGLISWQGIDLLLEVVSELRSQGFDLSVTIVGDGLARAEWEFLARKLGIASHVAFVGQISGTDVPQYIAGFDVGYSGQRKSMIGTMYHSPLKLYEYMAMAKPVVAASFEDARRVIDDRKTGFLFEPEKKDDLKRALVEVCSARSRLHEFGAKARERVITNHSWTARVSSMISQIERILSSS